MLSVLSVQGLRPALSYLLLAVRWCLMVWMKRVVLPSRVAGDSQQQGSSEALGLAKGQERTKPRAETPEGTRKGLLLSKL